MDDYWGDGRLSRYFIGGIPRVARINHDTLVTGPNVTFVCCSFECANALEDVAAPLEADTRSRTYVRSNPSFCLYSYPGKIGATSVAPR
jgi:hypothetical protein